MNIASNNGISGSRVEIGIDRYYSIDYKYEVTQFINILKNNINEKHIG